MMQSWCRTALSRALGSPVEDDLLDYLVSMEVEKDVREYLQDLLSDQDTAEVDAFLKEFFRHWSPSTLEPPPPSGSQLVQEQLLRPKKEELILYSKEGPPPGFKDDVCATPTTVQSSHGDRRPYPKPHPKQTFVPLLSAEGQSCVTTKLPGRHRCQCLAQKHELINNCIKCGRIVCSQEGSGPCLFCGAIVCTPEEESWILKDSKKARKLREQFLKKHNIQDIGRPLEHIEASPDVLTKAQHHKDKLLKFDSTSASRTKVIDDESDYFSVDSNRWLSGGERDALQSKEADLREKKYGSRKNKALTVHLDLAGRRAVQEEAVVDVHDEKHAKEALGSKSVGSEYASEGGGVTVACDTDLLYNPSIPTERPKFVDTRGTKKESKEQRFSKGLDKSGVKHTRLQDRTLQEMRDDGLCLSMHQPWATLLIAGIKRCEGRSWYSAHRGRLWIAAASKKPSPSEITQVQQTYTELCGDKENLFFPLKYPTGCLLGCVDMLDCLSQEEYREVCPQGESESEYVFIVEHPQELVVKFPITGQHKIWKLPKDVHQAAKKGVRIQNTD